MTFTGQRTIAIALLTGAAACKPTPPAPPVPHSATAVNASFGRTWDAVIDWFATQNIPIRTIERASGFIAAEQSRVPQMKPSKELAKNGPRWADCGKPASGALPWQPGSADYNVRVKGDSTRATVQVNVQWRTSPAGVSECNTKAVWEREVEANVKARAEASGK